MYAGIYRWVLVGGNGCLAISCQSLGLYLDDVKYKMKNGEKNKKNRGKQSRTKERKGEEKG